MDRPPVVVAAPGTADPATVQRIAAALLDGGVVVVPTDTVYGLAALPGDRSAMRRLFELKGRGEQAPVAVLCADADQALALAAPDAAREAATAAARWWPGPLTLVLERRSGVALHLGEPVTTIGLRVPDHPLVHAVAALVGPIAATSANRHGVPTPSSAIAAAASLVGPPDLVVDGGTLSVNASTVVDATSQPWRVLREGPIPGAEVLALVPED